MKSTVHPPPLPYHSALFFFLLFFPQPSSFPNKLFCPLTYDKSCKPVTMNSHKQLSYQEIFQLVDLSAWHLFSGFLHLRPCPNDWKACFTTDLTHLHALWEACVWLCPLINSWQLSKQTSNQSTIELTKWPSHLASFSKIYSCCWDSAGRNSK